MGSLDFPLRVNVYLDVGLGDMLPVINLGAFGVFLWAKGACSLVTRAL